MWHVEYQSLDKTFIGANTPCNGLLTCPGCILFLSPICVGYKAAKIMDNWMILAWCWFGTFIVMPLVSYVKLCCDSQSISVEQPLWYYPSPVISIGITLTLDDRCFTSVVMFAFPQVAALIVGLDSKRERKKNCEDKSWIIISGMRAINYDVL